MGPGVELARCERGGGGVMAEAARIRTLRSDADHLELVDRLDRIEHVLGRLVDDPRVTQLEPWLSKRELAVALGVSAKWVQERVREGLPHRTIAGGHKMRLSAVEPWLRDRGYLEETA